MLAPIGMVSFSAWNAHRTEREAHEKRVEFSDHLASLEVRERELEANIANLSDPYGVESELRKRYDIGREGEEVLVFVEKDRQGEEPERVPVEKKDWWERMKGWF